MALESLKVKPEEAIMIGDIVSTDIFGARVGMNTVLFQPTEEYQRSIWEHLDHTINTLKELLELLKLLRLFFRSF